MKALHASLRAPLAAGLAALALAACASSPSSHEPTTPPSPRITSAEQAIDAVLASDDCRAEALRDERPRAFAIGTSAWLVHIVCEQGAYQSVGHLYRVEASGELRLETLPIVSAAGALEHSEEVGEIEVDPSSLVITESVRYRGLGDCGRRVRARITPTGLALVEHREQTECPDDDDAEHVTDPAEWPLRSVVGAE
ncbi:MAG: DUF1176 domain-containing protein [Sandaracinaceae bacterium]|nr:DUF1176 domain-containing protein [Sandaracinaceae bacterium]